MTEEQDVQIGDWIQLDTNDDDIFLPIMAMFNAGTLTAAYLDRHCPRWYGEIAGIVKEWDETTKRFIQYQRARIVDKYEFAEYLARWVIWEIETAVLYDKSGYDDDDRDDDWSEDFERYMTETGWLVEDER